MKCDFCGLEGLVPPYWEWECPDFTLYLMFTDGQESVNFEGNWDACVVCNDLILQIVAVRDPDKITTQEEELTERGVQGALSIMHKEQDDPLVPTIRVYVREAQSSFFQHFTGRKVLHR